MPFVKRDPESGEVIGLFMAAQSDATEEITCDNEDVIEFLKKTHRSEFVDQLMQNIDIDFIRVLEDLVDLLMQKNVILLTELPVAAQTKLMKRKQVRATKQQNRIIDVDEEEIL